MTLKDLILKLVALQEEAPGAEVLIENGEWCDRIEGIRLTYFGQQPFVLLKNPENLRGNQS